MIAIDIYNATHVTEKYSNIRPSEVDYIKKKLLTHKLNRIGKLGSLEYSGGWNTKHGLNSNGRGLFCFPMVFGFTIVDNMASI